MCGIAIIATPHSIRYERELQLMCKSLYHRGPDGQGIQIYNNCALGHRRLSIVDLQTGAQPMCSLDKNIAVVFNGEIYGYEKLREELEYPFQTQSDTEILLAAYEKYGEAMCMHLPGMFAFAIWDDHRQQLFCGRDRFGEKPLYYSQIGPETLLLASEIKSILASGLLRPKLNFKALSAYLEWRYVPEGMTMYDNIHQLPPGHRLVFSNGILKMSAYWTLPPPMQNPPTLQEATEELKFLLERAVRNCLIADVEVGLLLSGGLDSGTIAALAARKRPIQAFGFGFEGEHNELPFARAVAEFNAISLYEQTSDSLKVPQLLEELPTIYDEPLADTSCLPTLLLCKAVSAHVKVALAGDGGDELLGGYKWYARLPVPGTMAEGIPNGWTPTAMAHASNMRICSSSEVRAAGLEPYSPSLPEWLSNTPDDAMRMDLTAFLPSDILRKTDRAAMSCGLELRSPFLEPAVSEFLIRLPWHFKRDAYNDKKILRMAFQRDHWPACLISRNKQGFGANPIRWLLQEDMRDFRAAYLCDTSLGLWDIFPKSWLKRHIHNTTITTWALLIFSLWYESTKKFLWK